MNKSFPSDRLVRHRAKGALSYLVSFSGATMVLSGCLVLMLAFSLCVAAGRETLSLWVAVPGVALALAYCVPWGVFGKATPAEEAEAADAARRRA